MDDILKHLYNACHPLYPADAKQYIDLSDVRSGGVYLQDIVNEIGVARLRPHADGKFIRKLFTGHSGCGKSSELKHLEAELQSTTPTFDHERYFPIYIDMLDHVDQHDASLPEILLAVTSEMAKLLRDEEKIELRNSYIEGLWAEIRKLLLAEVKPGKVDLPLWGAKAEINLKLADPTSREKVRASLLPQMTRLIEEINIVMDEARTKLRAHTPNDKGRVYEDLVLILDNMEKIQRASGREPGEDSYRALFLEGASQLTAINVQTIYTVPLSLVRAVGPELCNAYGCTIHILPNVKTEQRKRDANGKHERWEKGREKLIELLRHRTAPHAFENAFTPEAVEFLLDYCGGHIRQLMRYVQQACLRAAQSPIDLYAAEQAIGMSVQEFNSIRPSQWPLLAELEISSDQSWDNNDDAHRQLLEMLCVLEYMNGDRNDDMFNKGRPWYAVHPVIRELNPFKDAVKDAVKRLAEQQS